MSQTGSTNRGAMGELDPLIGRTISGRYRVHALIGQGGMGKVFQAQQIPLGRNVALKVLGMTHAAESDAEFQQRFFHEAAILAKLRSPHTVTVFDYGRDGDIYFIAMELVIGTPLDRVLREQGLLSAHHALGMAVQIARSLREAHALGVVHRDLKPANVLVAHTADGEEHVKVLDFGLAKQWAISKEDTNRDVVPGSPKYMAPEVIRQEPVDGRADIYALGILLYHMVTGRVPFDAHAPLDILMAHVQQPPPPMAQMNPNVAVPPQLEQMVLRCLAKRPEQRYQTMQEVIDALRALAGTLGLGGDMAGLSMLPPPATHTSTPGMTHSPSGRPLQQARTSDAPRLRLDLDHTPSGTQVRRGAEPSAKKLILPIAIATICGVLGALAVSVVMSRNESANAIQAAPLPPEPPEPAPAQAAQPAQPTPPAEPAAAAAAAQEEEPPVMDFTQGATAATRPAPTQPVQPLQQGGASTATPSQATGAPAVLPSVMITARSVPTGASVFVRGTKMGLTPVTFRFQDAAAKVGAPLSVVFQLKGHEKNVVTKTIGGASLLVDAVLQPSAEAAPAPAPEEEAEEEESEPSTIDERADKALRDLQEDEEAEEEEPAPKPVLKITESP